MALDARPHHRPFTRMEWLTLALVVLLYVLLLGHFRSFNIANPWYASYTYAWWHEHNAIDLLMQRRFPHGMGGVEAFGKLAAVVQGVVMDVLGWRVVNFEVLSLIFVSASVFLFGDAARRMGRSPSFIVAYVTVMGVAEQFAFAAEQARYEFLTLLLFALGMWFGTRRTIVLGAFLSALCMEIQPAGCLAFAGTAIFLLLLDRDHAAMKQRALRIALGALCAVPVYLLLHPHIIVLAHQMARGGPPQGRAGGFLVGYFLESKRHLVELPFLLAAGIAALRSRRYVLREWAAIAVGAAIIISALLRWDNPRYFAMLMPFLAWFIVDAFGEARWKSITAVACLIFLPQYAYRVVASMREPDFTSAEQDQVTAALDRFAAHVGKQPQDLQVRGQVGLWFAHPQNFIAFDLRTLLPGGHHYADVVLCFDQKLDPVLKEDSSEVVCSEVKGLPSAVETLDLHGRALHVVPAAGVDLQYPFGDYFQRLVQQRAQAGH